MQFYKYISKHSRYHKLIDELLDDPKKYYTPIKKKPKAKAPEKSRDSRRPS